MTGRVEFPIGREGGDRIWTAKLEKVAMIQVEGEGRSGRETNSRCRGRRWVCARANGMLGSALGRDKRGGGGVLGVALKAPGAGAGRLVQNRVERAGLGGGFAPSGRT